MVRITRCDLPLRSLSTAISVFRVVPSGDFFLRVDLLCVIIGIATVSHTSNYLAFAASDFATDPTPNDRNKSTTE